MKTFATVQQYQNVDESLHMVRHKCFLCNNDVVEPEITFHYFPRLEKIRELWMKICNISADVNVSGFQLCSKHFRRENFIGPVGTSLQRLSTGSLPSLLVPNPLPFCWEHKLANSASADTSVDTEAKRPPESNSDEETESSSDVEVGQSKIDVPKQGNEQKDIVMREPDEKNSPAERPSNLDNREESTKSSEASVKKSWKCCGFDPVQNQWIIKDDPSSLYWRTCFVCGIKVPGNSPIAFHKFPSSPKMCTMWKQVCNLTARDDVSTLKICSRHFRQSDYIQGFTCGKVGKLKLGVVPSIGVPNPLTPIHYRPKASPYLKNEKNNTSSVHKTSSNLNAITSSSVSSVDSTKTSSESAQQLVVVPKVTSSQTPPVTVPPLTNTGNITVPTATTSTNTTTTPLPKPVRKLTYIVVKKPKKKDVCPPQSTPNANNLGPVVRPQSAFKDGEPRVVMKRLSSSDLNKHLQRKESDVALPLHVVVKENPVDLYPEEYVPQSNTLDGNSEETLDSGNEILMSNINPSVCFLCNHRGNERVTLHRFPSVKSVRREWKRVCGLRVDEDVSRHRICSLHFCLRDYGLTNIRQVGPKKKLCRDAVPSINLRHRPKNDIYLKPGAGKNIWKEVCFLCNREGHKTAPLYWFPTLPAICKKWKQACGLNEYSNTTHLRICGKHFQPDDFVGYFTDPLHTKFTLQMGAVPSVNVPYSANNEPADPLAGVRIESVSSISKDSDVWDASNLLEVIVNESSEPMYFDSEDLRDEGESKITQRTCFLCNTKEEGKIFTPKSLHKFPENEYIRGLWKQACNLYDHDYMKTSSLLICSDHFCEDDYVAGTKLPGRTPVLKPEAVPRLHVPTNHLSEVSESLLSATKSTNTSNTSSTPYATGMSIDPEITVKEETLSGDEETENKNINSGSSANSRAPSPPKIRPVLRVKSVAQLLSNNVDDLMGTGQNNELLNRNLGNSGNNPGIERIDAVMNGPLRDPLFVPVSDTLPTTQPTNVPLITHLYPVPAPPNTQSVTRIAPGTISMSKPGTHFLCMPANLKLSQKPPLNKSSFIISQNTDNGYVLKIRGPAPASQKDIPNIQNTAKSFNIENCFYDFRPNLKSVSLTPPSQSEKVSGQTVETLPHVKLPSSSSSSQTGNNNVGHSSNTLVASSAPKLRSPEVMVETDKADPTSAPVAKRRRLSEDAVEEVSSDRPPAGEASGKLKPIVKQYPAVAITEQHKRIKQYVRTLDDLLLHLQRKDMLSKDAADILMNMVTCKSKTVIIRKLDVIGVKWTEDLRSFAHTLYLLSDEAYNYLDRIWPRVFVPHISEVRYWSKVEGGKPGFCSEILDALFLTKNAVCNVSISEMPIRQEMLFENNRFYGGVDFGSDQDMQNDNMVPAQSVLIFCVNFLSSLQRVPVGYFLIKSLDAKERANLLRRCIELLHAVGVVVLSVTIDGSLVNTSMCCHLCASFSYGVNFKPWFLHPITREKIFVIWDPRCMMKLVRDTLGDKGILVDYNHYEIKWSFFKELANVQSNKALNINTKICKSHIDYQKNRDDLNLSLQTFSRSVYNGFKTLTEKNVFKLKEADGTAKFSLMLNDIFDMLTSRNKCMKKAHQIPVFQHPIFRNPISEPIYASLHKSALACVGYIRGLTDENLVNILQTPRKTGFLGLIVCLINVFEVYNCAKKLGVTHLCTNKLSLDYARTFSCAMQGNKQRLLNAKEFEERFKEVVLKRVDVNTKTDILMDGVEILKVLSKKDHYRDPICNYENGKLDESKECVFFKASSLFGPLEEDEIKYISGFVVGQILKKNICSICASHISIVKKIHLPTLQGCKRARDYYIPTKDVCRICKIAERVLRENRHLKLKLSNINFFVIKTFNRVFQDVFNTRRMNSHVMEQDCVDNHRTQLCKLIAETYFKMRIIHESR